MDSVTLGSYGACERCGLHKECHSVGVGGRLFVAYEGEDARDAVVFVGEAPGANEDREGKCFIGKSGRFLDEFYVYGPGLQELVDVYATNAVKCKPASDKPSVGQIKACRPYLMEDIRRIARVYDRVLVVMMGAYAVKAVMGVGLAEQFNRPMEKWEEVGLNVWVQGTYHPAYSGGYDTGKQKLVMDQLMMTREWLEEGEISYEDMPEPIYAPKWEEGVKSLVTFDLETYNCLRAVKPTGQSVFHPKKMRYLDGFRKDQMLVTAQVAWRDRDGELKVGWFEDRNKVHRERLWEWLKRAKVLGGHNVSFDVKLIRYCHGLDKIPAWRSLRDSMVETFMYDDIHPRGLKAIVPLYRITNYNHEPKALHVYDGPKDPRLIRYGCKDAWATHRAIEKAWMRMVSLFKDHPNAKWKVSQRRLDWYSDQLWSSILMEEAGVPFDTDRLLVEHEKASTIVEECKEEGWKKFDLVIAGEGSQKDLQKLMVEAYNEIGERLLVQVNKGGAAAVSAGEDLNNLESIEKTKTGKCKVDKDTRNLMLGLAPSDTRAAETLSLLTALKGAEKLVGTYTGQRLFGKKKQGARWVKALRMNGKKLGVGRFAVGDKYDLGNRLIRLYRKGEYTGVAMGYPSWFILPKGGDKGKSGGVRQYRWSAKDPAVQTDPKAIKKCMTSRYGQGVLGGGDYGQMEWRMAAYLGNDKVMLREIREGLDPHIEAASILLDVNLRNEREVRAWLLKGALGVLCRSPNYLMRTEARKFIGCKSRGDFSGDFVGQVVKYCRQEGGKSENFAYLFGATAHTVRNTLRTKAGFDVDVGYCAAMIRNNNKKYVGLKALRGAFMEEALQFGAIHLPILGLTRTFTEEEDDIKGKYRGQVYDFGIQCLSGLVLQSAAIEIQKFQIESGLSFKVVLNNHDFVGVDARKDCAENVFKFTRRKLLSNPFLSLLEEHYGRKFPISVEMEVLATRGIGSRWVKDFTERIA